MGDNQSSAGRPRGWARRAWRATAGKAGALEWLGRHEWHILLVGAAMLMSIWAFVEIADEVMEGDVQQYDEAVVRAMRRPDDPATPVGPRWLHGMARDVTSMGSMTVLAILVLIVMGYLLMRRQYRATLLILVATAGGTLLSSLLKYLFERERPRIVEHLDVVYLHSFPSGHSMLSTVVYLTLGALLGRVISGWRMRAYFLLVAVVLAVLVGVSRVYLGVHYPTDVLAGWAAGFAWATFCWQVARYLQRHGTVEPVADDEPGSGQA